MITNSLEKSIFPQKVPNGANAFFATLTFAWRSIKNIKNNVVAYSIDAFISPIFMLLIFNFLFGGAIAGSTSDYLHFLLPGILIMTVVPMTAYSGSIISTDITKGVFNRFRTLPFWQPAAILGPLITDGIRYTLALLVSLCMGILLGFRPEAGVSGTIFALLFIVFFAFSVSWIFTMIGIIAKKPETVSGMSMIFVYPLIFASTLFVDSDTMPNWIQFIVDLNPLSIAVSTVRGLMYGTANFPDILQGIGICTLLVIVFASLTLHLYRVKNEHR